MTTELERGLLEVEVSDVPSISADLLCHWFVRSEWPKALCGYDVSGRKRHDREICASEGHGVCSSCALIDRNRRRANTGWSAS